MEIVVALKGIVIHEGKILIVQRAGNDDIGAGTWECVGGKLEFGEDLETALHREIQEESGLDVKVGRILYATTFQTSLSRQVVILTYLCTSRGSEVNLSDEHADYLWATQEQLKALLPDFILKDFEESHIFELEELS
ncbi:NUDIX domain-containing protein [Bacillus sp. AGMB 02131]|uniref:NUDIX domain-containing protein n=1 Tax=Peribacillus faecalis TaxID=2772559 RepID=A0A927CY34_9BACI|nr:NUDIX domain-containing protein [Peribacillus faecalis]MBD3107444.1 NUDIX domain-containing protein [Peribacillus faecalis]